MAYDPKEPHWRKDDDYDPSRDGPEARMAREQAKRSGYGADMDDRSCEKEPSRCTRCGLVQRIEYRVQRKQFFATMMGWHTEIETPWPVAVCGLGHREEM
jgi:hypothetical protein